MSVINVSLRAEAVKLVENDVLLLFKSLQKFILMVRLGCRTTHASVALSLLESETYYFAVHFLFLQ